jgi:micrococcal nuclease
LVQIDTPELAQGECYAKQAKTALERLLPARVRLEFDPRLDQVDRFGRQLAYVFAGRTNVNVALVRRGAASVWFYHGARGKYAGRLLWAARQAREDGLGLWLACGATRFDPLHAVETQSAPPPPRRPTAQPEG